MDEMTASVGALTVAAVDSPVNTTNTGTASTIVKVASPSKSSSRSPKPSKKHLNFLFPKSHSGAQDNDAEPEPYGDAHRLADLGSNILETVITFHLFSKRPMTSVEEISVSVVCITRITEPQLINRD